ncbi:hypothetical protein B0T26DRAFT_428925 [Lasiosphaeria miniovina]|uniref:Uncharacterized protein n=1 Tax=Lasiosphaeria miniovina TaxID=1954250 RepID=A0AA40A628_9PEZI|nr:uncharacterized protein B0T26DRAFT_428925 [Lasiosphaeria miniovina]KAK0709934.1 hypothetical protein B0T26DRAFT_428925 [Lasiosphaeria miniovina]
MSSTAETKIVLRSAKDWPAWKDQFIGRAKGELMWQYIDPKEIFPKPFPSEPTEPNINHFEFKVPGSPAVPDPANSGNLTNGNHTPNSIYTLAQGHPPASDFTFSPRRDVSDLADRGFQTYSFVMTDYHRKVQMYKDKQQAVLGPK